MTSDSKRKKNIYLCRVCGTGFVSEDLEKGVTPFLTTCLNPSCGKLAHSLCYRCPQEMLHDVKPALEWYRPNPEEMLTADIATTQHVEKGGLISRRTQ